MRLCERRSSVAGNEVIDVGLESLPQELRMVKVDTSEQLADFLTKPVTAKWLAEKSPELGLEFREGRSSLQRGLVS